MSIHIVELTVTNFKGIKAVAINAEGKSLVQITGKAGQGKTSVIDAIWAALGGRQFTTGTKSEKTTKPIRAGEKRASVRLDLGEMIVTRVWTKDGPGELTVQSARGAVYNGPQGVLDELLGRFAFDITAFARQTESEQISTLIDVIRDDLPFDPEALERQREMTFEERKVANRLLKQKEAIAQQGWALDLSGIPDEPVAVTAILAEKQAVEDHNRMVEREERHLSTLQTDHGLLLSDAERIKDMIETAQSQLEKTLQESDRVAENMQKKQAEVDALEYRSTEQIDERLGSVDATNRQVEEKRRHQAADAEYLEQKAVAEALTKKLADIDTLKTEGIKSAKLPYPDLSFDESGVTLKGIPFKQVSGTERLLASAALAMAMNPELRILRVDGGEALDSEGLAALEKLAGDNDYQVWVSRVSEHDDGDVVIFDGAAVEA